MKHTTLSILRITIGITFIWIAILIFRAPEGWGSLIQPWAMNLLPLPLRQVMIDTAVLDLFIGFAFVLNRFTWLAALVSTLHLIIILITSGINDVTVRDIGLIGVTAVLFLEYVPDTIAEKLPLLKKLPNRNKTSNTSSSV